jgi:hypothetical protein
MIFSLWGSEMRFFNNNKRPIQKSQGAKHFLTLARGESRVDGVACCLLNEKAGTVGPGFESPDRGR